MFERREEGLLALTAGRLRHGRHGSLTHIRRPLELRAGPGGPLLESQAYDLLQYQNRTHPPTDSISGESKVCEPSARWVTASVCVGTPPSHFCFLWPVNASHSAARIEGAAGVKGCQGLTPPHAL